ncbi:hypothetical protein [Halalkalibaculum sp. DA384]|uniref:hypothetical protein n=1 Tax=Halalkalibaculum sp. DA384 TaxID=3373606 RepID=UPI0037548AA8
MTNAKYQILCQQLDQLKTIQQLLSRQTGAGGEVTSLIVPITIGNNDPQRFVQRNANRVGLVIHNNSGSALYLALSNDEVQVGETFYSFYIPGNDHLILDQDTLLETYKGELWGVWEQGAPADSRAMITELSKEVAV